MNPVTVSLSQEDIAFIEERQHALRLKSRSEYIRRLIHVDQRNQEKAKRDAARKGGAHG